MSATTAGRTVLGPLTTTFTPAPSCRIATAQGDYANIGKWTAFGAQTCDGSNSGFTLFDVSSCWPPTSSGAAALNTASAGWGFYSPGLICPSGYVSACSATAGGASGWQQAFYMSAGETAVGCCPSGYTCTNAPWARQSCYSQAGAYDSFTVETCSSGMIVSLTTPTLPITTSWTAADGGLTTGAVNSFDLWNPMIEIRWQSSDRAEVTQTSSGGSGAIATAGGQKSGGGGGLSTGAQAGIGVGVALGVLILLGAAFLFWRRSRRQKPGHIGMSEIKQEQQPAVAKHQYQDQQPLQDQDQYRSPGIANQAAPQYTYGEMDATPKVPQEMHGEGFTSSGTHELPADSSAKKP